jgi:hypothetical protein
MLSKRAFMFIMRIYRDIKKKGSIEDLLCLKSFIYRSMESRWYTHKEYRKPSEYIENVLIQDYEDRIEDLLPYIKRQMASGEGRCFFDFLLERDYTRMI